MCVAFGQKDTYRELSSNFARYRFHTNKMYITFILIYDFNIYLFQETLV